MLTPLAGFLVAKPTTGPSASVSTIAGGLNSQSVYQYKVTFVSAFGETNGNTTASSVTTDSMRSVLLSSIPVSTNGNVNQRKIYRTIGGGSVFLLLATINDNTTSTYLDVLADSTLGSAIPTLNSAHSRQVLNGYLKASKPNLYSIATGLVANPGGGQLNAVQLSEEINIVSTVATAADSFKLPEISTNLIGMRVVIANDGANSTNVFPTAGQDASGGVDTAVPVAAAARAEFVAKSATAWEKIR